MPKSSLIEPDPFARHQREVFLATLRIRQHRQDVVIPAAIDDAHGGVHVIAVADHDPPAHLGLLRTGSHEFAARHRHDLGPRLGNRHPRIHHLARVRVLRDLLGLQLHLVAQGAARYRSHHATVGRRIVVRSATAALLVRPWPYPSCDGTALSRPSPSRKRYCDASSSRQAARTTGFTTGSPSLSRSGTGLPSESSTGLPSESSSGTYSRHESFTQRSTASDTAGMNTSSHASSALPLLS